MRKFYQLTFCSMLALFTFGLNFAVFGQLGTIQIGSGTSTSTGSQAIPVTNYDFSYSQQIVTAAQYIAAGGTTGPITKIRYYCTSVGTASVWNNWTVLLGNTSKTAFTSATDWVPLAELTEVFNGVITPVANDWFEITFTTPFNYTGGNIVVAIDENTMGYTSAPTFRSFTSGANTGILARIDGATNNIDPAAPLAANYRGSNVPQIQFEGTLATCPVPSALASSNITDNSVDLTWTAGGTETAWNIEWGTPGFTPGTGAEAGSDVSAAPSATVSGLSDATTYDIYIQADCGAGDESFWVGPISVTTIQLPVSLPYSDDFSTSEWVLSNGSQANAWYVGAAEGNPVNGLYISNDGGTTNAYTISGASSTVHASKVFELPAGTMPFNFSFDWKANGESTSDYLRVWLVPASAALTPGTAITTGNTPGAVRISNQYLNGVTAWQTANLEIPASYAGSIVKIVFEWRNDGSVGTNPPAAVDNIAFTEITCLVPTALTASNITDNSVDLSWTPGGTETAWNIEWGAPGFIPGTGAEIGSASVTATTTTVNGLSEQTTYQIYVQADCGSGDESLWTGPISVTTIQTPASLPYSDDFSTSEWVLSNGSQTNKWFIGSATGNPANSLYVTNDNGVTNAYTISSAASVVHATKTFAFPAGNPFTLEFDWKSAGESGYDYLRVWLIPATANPTPGTQVSATNIPGSLQLGGNHQTTTAWTTASYTIPDSYAGTTAKLVFEWRNDGGTGTNPPAAVDNISITQIACIVPSALVSSNTTENSFDVSWTPGGTETQWNVIWGLSGFTPGDANEVGSETVTAASHAITGLNSETSYDVYVQTDCGSGNLSEWVGPLTVYTGHCVPTGATNYYVSTFVTTNALTNINYSASSGVGYVDSTSTVLNTYPNNQVNYTITPSGGTNYFYIWVDWNNDLDFSDAGETILATTTYASNNSGSFMIPSGQASGNYRMRIANSWSGAITACGPSSNGNYVDFTLFVEDISCYAPLALTLDDVTDETVTVSWTPGGTETSWNVIWGTSGFTPGDANQIGSDVATATSYTISGLTENTTYDVYVQADCGSGDLSYWTGPVGALTACTAIPAIGFCEDFESSDALDCWAVINANSDSDAWSIYTGYANSGNQSAGLYTDYNGGSNDDYLVLPRMTLTGNEILTFHYRARSSSEPNDFRVVLSTTGSDAADFTEVILPLMSISNTTYQDTSINLSAYSGDVYIAFHVPAGGLDGYYLYIDDVCVDVCTPVAGIDGDADVCRLDGTVDLNTVITSPYTHGTWSSATHPGLLNGSSFDVSTLANGAYELMYVITTACTSDTTIATVNVVNPSSAGEDGMLTACKNQMIDLFGGLSGTVDFGGTWYTVNGTPLTSSYFQTGTLVGQTVYKYVVSNGACPADTSEVMVNIQNCDFLGLDDVSLLDNVTIVPNPNAGVFQITGIPGMNYTYEVVDVNGRVISAVKPITSTVTDVNISDVERGVYIVRIAGNNSERMIRVIKQ